MNPVDSLPVLTIGDCNPDIVLHNTDTNLLQNSMFNKTPLRAKVFGGGTVANTAHGLANLDEQVYFIGKVGDDAYGSKLIEELSIAGVNVEHIIRGRGLFTCLIMAVINNNERTIFVWPPHGAAHMQLQISEIPDDILNKVGWVHSTGISLREDPTAITVLNLMERSKALGIPVSFDLNLRNEFFSSDNDFLIKIDRAIKASNFVFGSGKEEISPLTSIDNPQKAAKSLVTSDRSIISRSGADGVSVFSQKNSFSIPAFTVPVLDTIGAGDVFNSGFIKAIRSGKSLKEAALWGNACAGLSITKESARSCPTFTELQLFLNQHTCEIKEL